MSNNQPQDVFFELIGLRTMIYQARATYTNVISDEQINELEALLLERDKTEAARKAGELFATIQRNIGLAVMTQAKYSLYKTFCGEQKPFTVNPFQSFISAIEQQDSDQAADIIKNVLVPLGVLPYLAKNLAESVVRNFLQALARGVDINSSGCQLLAEILEINP